MKVTPTLLAMLNECAAMYPAMKLRRRRFLTSVAAAFAVAITSLPAGPSAYASEDPFSTREVATWSAPKQVNTNTPATRPGFTPAVAVNSAGQVAVTYYDFRNNTSSPGLTTDAWIVFATPRSPLKFGGEQRLTTNSFNLELAPNAYRILVKQRVKVPPTPKRRRERAGSVHPGPPFLSSNGGRGWGKAWRVRR